MPRGLRTPDLPHLPPPPQPENVLALLRWTGSVWKASTGSNRADTGNQLLLLKGLRRARRRPDARHPFGYGAELFYWSLLAALGMFVVGGVLSVWEGAQRLLHPVEVRVTLLGLCRARSRLSA